MFLFYHVLLCTPSLPPYACKFSHFSQVQIPCGVWLGTSVPPLVQRLYSEKIASGDFGQHAQCNKFVGYDDAPLWLADRRMNRTIVLPSSCGPDTPDLLHPAVFVRPPIPAVPHPPTTMVMTTKSTTTTREKPRTCRRRRSPTKRHPSSPRRALGALRKFPTFLFFSSPPPAQQQRHSPFQDEAQSTKYAARPTETPFIWIPSQPPPRTSSLFCGHRCSKSSSF